MTLFEKILELRMQAINVMIEMLNVFMMRGEERCSRNRIESGIGHRKMHCNVSIIDCSVRDSTKARVHITFRYSLDAELIYIRNNLHFECIWRWLLPIRNSEYFRFIEFRVCHSPDANSEKKNYRISIEWRTANVYFVRKFLFRFWSLIVCLLPTGIYRIIRSQQSAGKYLRAPHHCEVCK